MQPDKGKVIFGKGVCVGYFSQDTNGLDYDTSGLENLLEVTKDKTLIFKDAQILGLTNENLQKKPSEMSRGQQAKLGFAKLLLTPNQLLILDEPTNHLDIQTRERIEAALKNYQGAILVASHDKYFLEQIGIDRIVSFI
jgi:ATPase subunit of ABC transporter with duplicated ATPase domains